MLFTGEVINSSYFQVQYWKKGAHSLPCGTSLAESVGYGFVVWKKKVPVRWSDASTRQSQKGKVSMKVFLFFFFFLFSVASITKAGECAMKPPGGRFKTNRGRYFFPGWVFKLWEPWQQPVAGSRSTQSFRNRLKVHRWKTCWGLTGSKIATVVPVVCHEHIPGNRVGNLAECQYEHTMLLYSSLAFIAGCCQTQKVALNAIHGPLLLFLCP